MVCAGKKGWKTLQIIEENGRSTLGPWDVEHANRGDYLVRHELVREYALSGKGDRMKVAACLRPLLEGNIRMRFPEHCPPSAMLGQFVNQIRTAKDGHPLFAMKRLADEMEALNDYTKQFHHSGTSAVGGVEPLETELRQFARRTLSFAAGLPA